MRARFDSQPSTFKPLTSRKSDQGVSEQEEVKIEIRHKNSQPRFPTIRPITDKLDQNIQESIDQSSIKDSRNPPANK